MTTVLYVHGIGDRTEVEPRLKDIGPRISDLPGSPQLDFLAWGVQLGTPRLTGKFKSVPEYRRRGGGAALLTAEETQAEAMVNLWELLYRDPLFELKLLGVLPRPDSGGDDAFGGGPSAAEELGTRVGRSPARPEVDAALGRSGLEGVFNEARRRVMASPAFEKALATAETASSTRHREAIARSILATSVLMCQALGQTPAFLGDPQIRKDLEATLAADFGPAEAAVPAWITEPFLRIRRFVGGTVADVAKWGKDVAVAEAERRIVDNAGRLADLSHERVGDVLLYQSKGERIRKALSEKVQKLAEGGDVVLLCHSLGGIAAFEMLIEHLRLSEDKRPWKADRVPLLITVGSQAPFLYELNALQTLETHDDRDPSRPNLPPEFPRWLNLFDPRDLLSFLVEPVFLGAKIRDVQIDNLQPFPQSHGAYWVNPKSWEAIREEFEQTGLAAPIPTS